ncbi:MAG TPA: hypothetical protein VGD64_11160 [Acidisarcina sp.]
MHANLPPILAGLNTGHAPEPSGRPKSGHILMGLDSGLSVN